MALAIKLLLFVLALIHFTIGVSHEDKEEKHFYLISSDIFIVGLLLAILITY